MTTGDPLLTLARAAAEGDDRAVAELVVRTEQVVWLLCRALGSGDDAEDLVQETYVRALRALPSFRGEAPFQAWLLSIARRVCADAVRARQRQRKLRHRLYAQRVPSEVVQPPPTDIAGLVEGLAEERREAFLLTQVVGLSYEDAAAVVGCPIGTIRSRVSRARAELAERIHEAEAQ